METSAPKQKVVWQAEYALHTVRQALFAYAEELVRHAKNLEEAVQHGDARDVANWVIAISTQSNSTARIAGRWQGLDELNHALAEHVG